MGIIDRMSTVVRANVNELLDNMSDPAKEIDLLVHDMSKAERRATEELIAALGDLKLTQKHVAVQEGEVDKWRLRAEQAVRAGDDALARDALREKVVEQRKLDETRRVEQEQQAQCDALRRSMRLFSEKLSVIKARKETLKQQVRAARQGQSALDGGQAFKDLAAIEGKIDALEAEVQVTEEFDGRRAATEAKFAGLEHRQPDPKVEDDLAALKRRMDELD